MNDNETKNKPTKNDSTDKKVFYRLDDSAILMIRELLQLSLLTQTNIVDQFRTLRFEVKDDKIVSSDDYVKSYNEMIQALETQAEAAMASMDDLKVKN